MPDETDWAAKRSDARAALRQKHRAASGSAPPAASPATTARGSIGSPISHARHGAPLLATNDVLYHEPGRRVLQDVVTCIREHWTIVEAGRRLEANAERHIKTPEEMARLFREHPRGHRRNDALCRAHRLQPRRAQIQLSHRDHRQWRDAAGDAGAADLGRCRERYPNGVPDAILKTLWSELCLIAYKGYAPYFLTVHDIVHYARYDLKILCQGRGSAANSAVCFCLEITEVDPDESVDLVFGRFLSAPSATSRPTSTSISSTSGAKR